MEKKTFLGNSGFIWWVGVVENRKDPLNIGRCQVRIFGWHTENKSLIPTENLPWAQPALPINNAKTFTTPVEGDWVVGFFFDGESGQFPCYFGVLPSIPSPYSNNPQQGFTDPRSDAELMKSPAPPKQIEPADDGSGTETKDQPAKRNPQEVGFPTVNKAAINNSENPPPQIVQRIVTTTTGIAGPDAKSITTAIAGAAQGAAQVLQGTQPQLEALVPKAEELAAQISPVLSQAQSQSKALLEKAQGDLTNLAGSAGNLLSAAQNQGQAILSQMQSSGLATGVPQNFSDEVTKGLNEIAEKQKNILEKSQASVAAQIEQAQAGAAEAAKKAQEALSKDLATLQSESKNIANSIADKLKNLAPSNVSTKTPVVLDVGSLTSTSKSFETSLYKNTPDSDLTYTGKDPTVWDRVNSERLRRGLSSLTDLGYPKPEDGTPPATPKADVGSVAPAPLVNIFAPNSIPDKVPLEKIGSTQKKSIENSVTLFEQWFTGLVQQEVERVNKSQSQAELTAIRQGFYSLRTAVNSKISELVDAAGGDLDLSYALGQSRDKLNQPLRSAINFKETQFGSVKT